MVNDMTQRQMAEILVSELEAFGVLRDESEGEVLDEIIMLDALACAGLALYEPAFENSAAREFKESLREVDLDAPL